MATMGSALGHTMGSALGNYSVDLRDVDVDDVMLNSYLFDFGNSMSATAMMSGNDPQARLAAIMATPAGDPNAVDFTIPEHEGVPAVQPMFSGLMSRLSPNNMANNIASMLPERMSKRNAREAVRAVAAQEEPSSHPSHGPSHTSLSHSDDDGKSSKSAPKGRATVKARGRKASSKTPKDPLQLAALQEKNRRAQRRFRERQRNRVQELEDKVAELERRLANVQVERNNLQSRNGILEKVAVMQEDKVHRLASFAKSSRSLSAAIPEEYQTGDITLTFQDELPITLSTEDVRKLGPEQLSAYFREYVSRLGGVLMVAGQNPNGPEAESVNRLTSELVKLVMRIALLSPPIIKQFMIKMANEHPTMSASVSNAELWPLVLRAMSLSKQQRQDMIQLRRLFLNKLLRVVQQRAEINAQLATALPHGTESRDAAMEFLRAHNSIDELKGNLKEEHILVQDFLSTLLRHVLTNYQVARGIVQCYPLVPDCLALCTWVAAEAGEHDALQAVTCGNVPNFPLPGGSTHTTPSASPAPGMQPQLVSTPQGMMQQPVGMAPVAPAPPMAPPTQETLMVEGVGPYVPFTMYSQQLPQHLDRSMSGIAASPFTV